MNIETDKLGVSLINRISGKVIPLSVTTKASRHFKFYYSLPQPEKPGWVNFNVALRVLQVIENTSEIVFVCEYISIEQIRNNKNIPARSLMEIIAEQGIRSCLATLQDSVESPIHEATLTSEDPTFPLSHSLDEAEHEAKSLFLDYHEKWGKG